MLVDDDLAFAVSLFDFTRPLVKRRPLQPRKRRSFEMTVNDATDEGGLAIAVGAREIELATAIHSAIAVIVSLALEFPLVRHRGDPLGVTALRNGILRSCKPSHLLPTLSRSPCR